VDGVVFGDADRVVGNAELHRDLHLGQGIISRNSNDPPLQLS